MMGLGIAEILILGIIFTVGGACVVGVIGMLVWKSYSKPKPLSKPKF